MQTQDTAWVTWKKRWIIEMDGVREFGNSVLQRDFMMMGVEYSGEGIIGNHSHNAKPFERIEHSGSW